MQVGELFVTLAVDMKNFISGLDSAKAKMAETQRSADSFMNTLKNTFKYATVGAAAYEAFALVENSIKNAIGAGINFNSQMQQSEIAFTTFLGSAEKAKAFVDELWQFAAATPFEFPQLQQAANRMLAFGFAAQDVLPMLKAVGDAAAGLGLSGEEGINRILLALGQMYAKTKVSAEEMMQLTEAGIPAWNILADAMHKSTAEVMDLSSKGLIPANFAIQALIQGMEQKFPDMMDKQSKSFAGMISTMKDGLNSTFGQIMKPTFDWLNNTALPGIINKLNQFSQTAKDKGLQEAFKKIFPPELVDAVNKFGQVLNQVFGIIKSVFSFIQQYSGPVTTLVIGFATAWLGFKTAGMAITTFKGLFNGLVSVINGARLPFQLVNTTIANYDAGLRKTATTMALYPGTVRKMTIATDAFKAAVVGLGVTFDTLFGWLVVILELVALLAEAWVNDWGGIQEKTKAVVQYIVAAFNSMAVGIATAWNELKKVIWENVNKLLDWIKPAVDLLGKVVPSVYDWYNGAMAAAANRTSDATLNIQKLRIEAEKTTASLTEAANNVRTAFSSWDTPKKPVGFGDYREDTKEPSIPDIDVNQLQLAAGAADDFGNATEKAGKKATEAAEDTRAAWEITVDTLQSRLQVLRAQYDLATATMDQNASEADKLQTELKFLNSEYAIQKQIVEQARIGYEQMKAAKGETAKETADAAQKYAQEAKNLADLTNQINEATLALQRQEWITNQVKARMEEFDAQQELNLAKLDEQSGKLVELQTQLTGYTQKLQLQRELIQSLQREYESVAAAKGKDADETHKAYMELLKAETEEANIQKQIRDTNKSIQEQIDQFKQLTDKVTDLANKYKNDLAQATDDYQKKVADVNQKLADDIQKANDDFQKALDDRAKSLRDFAGLFDEIKPKDVTGQQLLDNLRTQVQTFEQWQTNLKTLTARGVDQGLVAELRDMGPKAAAEIAALTTLTDDQLNEYVALWRQKNADAKQEATNELSDLSIQTQQKIAELRIQASQQLEQYRQEWQQKTQQIKDDTVNQLKQLVEDAAKQGTEMIVRMADAITKAMPQLASALAGLPGFDQQGGDDQVKKAQQQQSGVVQAAVEQKQGVIDATLQMSQTVIQTWTDTNTQISTKTDEVKNKLITTWQQIQQQLFNLWQKMIIDLQKTWNDMRKFLFDVTNQIQVRFEGLVNSANRWGVSLMSNFIAGIQSQFNRLRETLEFMTMMVDSYMPHSPAKTGPLSRLGEWGPALVNTFADGINKSLPTLENVTNRMAALSPAALGTAIGSINTSNSSVTYTTHIEKIELSTAATDPEEIFEFLEREIWKRGYSR